MEQEQLQNNALPEPEIDTTNNGQLDSNIADTPIEQQADADNNGIVSQEERQNWYDENSGLSPEDYLTTKAAWRNWDAIPEDLAKYNLDMNNYDWWTDSDDVGDFYYAVKKEQIEQAIENNPEESIEMAEQVAEETPVTKEDIQPIVEEAEQVIDNNPYNNEVNNAEIEKAEKKIGAFMPEIGGDDDFDRWLAVEEAKQPSQKEKAEELLRKRLEEEQRREAFTSTQENRMEEADRDSSLVDYDSVEDALSENAGAEFMNEILDEKLPGWKLVQQLKALDKLGPGEEKNEKRRKLINQIANKIETDDRLWASWETHFPKEDFPYMPHFDVEASNFSNKSSAFQAEMTPDQLENVASQVFTEERLKDFGFGPRVIKEIRNDPLGYLRKNPKREGTLRQIWNMYAEVNDAPSFEEFYKYFAELKDIEKMAKESNVSTDWAQDALSRYTQASADFYELNPDTNQYDTPAVVDAANAERTNDGEWDEDDWEWYRSWVNRDKNLPMTADNRPSTYTIEKDELKQAGESYWDPEEVDPLDVEDKPDDTPAQKEEKKNKRKFLKRLKLGSSKSNIFEGDKVTGEKTKVKENPNIKSGVHPTNIKVPAAGGFGGSSISGMKVSLPKDKGTEASSKAGGGDIKIETPEYVNKEKFSGSNNSANSSEHIAETMNNIGKSAGQIKAGATNLSGKEGHTSSGVTGKLTLGKNINVASIKEKIIGLSKAWPVENGAHYSGNKFLPFKFWVKDDTIEISQIGTGRHKQTLESFLSKEPGAIKQIMGVLK